MWPKGIIILPSLDANLPETSQIVSAASELKPEPCQITSWLPLASSSWALI